MKSFDNISIDKYKIIANSILLLQQMPSDSEPFFDLPYYLLYCMGEELDEQDKENVERFEKRINMLGAIEWFKEHEYIPEDALIKYIYDHGKSFQFHLITEKNTWYIVTLEDDGEYHLYSEKSNERLGIYIGEKL